MLDVLFARTEMSLASAGRPPNWPPSYEWLN